MNTILIVLKIAATIAVFLLAKDSALLPLRLVDDDVIPKWRKEAGKILLLALFVIIIIWL